MATEITTQVVPEVDPEDIEIIEQLAKLQNMHQEQILELRKLLPNALLEPARRAWADPKFANRNQLAVKMSKAAQKGKEDLHRFAMDWRDEKTRKVLREAGAADLDQGVDTWFIDYEKMAKASRSLSDKGDNEPFDTPEEAKVAFDSFGKAERNIKLTRNTPDDIFPLTIEVGRMHFRVTTEDDSYRLEPIGDGGPGTRKLDKQVAEQLSKPGLPKKLDKVLTLLEAYHDVRTRKCDSCLFLVDERCNLTTVRKQKAIRGQEGPAQWLALHSDCPP